jgi:RNA methyltransferase, TrmH family
MITSPDNQHLKQIRKLARKPERERTGLFCAEGEDLIVAAQDAGVEPDLVLWAGADVEPELLAAASTLGSGTRVIGIYPQRFSEPGGQLSLYLHGVGDPGNVGTAIRTAHALCDGPVVLGPDCADPYSPKAVRASMGSLFARPPARARLDELAGLKLALDAGAERSVADVVAEGPVVVCLGAERAGLSDEVRAGADLEARVPLRPDGPESLNVAAAGAVALYELARAASRMARNA